MKKLISVINQKLLGFYLIIAFLILWEAAPRIGWVDAQFLPPLSKVFAAGKQLGLIQILINIAVSLKRTFIGFALAVVFGLPLGFVLGGWLPKLSSFLHSLFSFLSQVPAFILFPVFVIIFGIGENGKYMVIFWAAFWPVLFTTIVGVQQVDPLLIKSAKSMGANGITIFFRVVIPGSLASIFTGIRTGMTVAFMMLIGAESLGADSGLGWLIHNSQQNGFIPRIYVGVVVVAALGLAINYLLEWLENDILVWREPSTEKGLG